MNLAAFKFPSAWLQKGLIPAIVETYPIYIFDFMFFLGINFFLNDILWFWFVINYFYQKTKQTNLLNLSFWWHNHLQHKYFQSSPLWYNLEHKIEPKFLVHHWFLDILQRVLLYILFEFLNIWRIRDLFFSDLFIYFLILS